MSKAEGVTFAKQEVQRGLLRAGTSLTLHRHLTRHAPLLIQERHVATGEAPLIHTGNFDGRAVMRSGWAAVGPAIDTAPTCPAVSKAMESWRDGVHRKREGRPRRGTCQVPTMARHLASASPCPGAIRRGSGCTRAPRSIGEVSENPKSERAGRSRRKTPRPSR